jgi:DNA-binding transcriptional ArsR family regulator
MELHSLLKAIGDKTSWDLLNILLEEALCGQALATRLGIAPSVVSQKVNVLQRTGLVTAINRGYWTFYEVDKKLLRQIQQNFNEWVNQAKGKQTKKCIHQENPIKKGGKKEARGHCETECLRRATKRNSTTKKNEGSKDERLNLKPGKEEAVTDKSKTEVAE